MYLVLESIFKENVENSGKSECSRCRRVRVEVRRILHYFCRYYLKYTTAKLIPIDTKTASSTLN